MKTLHPEVARALVELFTRTTTMHPEVARRVAELRAEAMPGCVVLAVLPDGAALVEFVGDDGERQKNDCAGSTAGSSALIGETVALEGLRSSFASQNGSIETSQ